MRRRIIQTDEEIKAREEAHLVLAVVICLVFVIIPAIIRMIFTTGTLPPPGELRMEIYFQRDKALMNTVVEYFANSDLHRFSIRRTDMSMTCITNNEVKEAVRHLFSRGYRIISISPTYTISFQRWANLDASHGIVYSVTNEVPTDYTVSFLTEIYPLSEKNWYFYISNFVEWRYLRQRHN